MDLEKTELLEKIRQQFDSAPFPKTPVEVSPKADANGLFIHNLVTPYYLRTQQVINPQDMTVLDLGCGSGYKTLILAEANPGATIVGVDLSEKSVELARQRLQFHGFKDAQFHALSLDQISELGLMFDYINCDEVLYLMPDLVQALQTLKSVLKPTGILRGNLHSLYQRQDYFRAQQLFTAMGLMQRNPEETEISIVLDTMRAIVDDAPLKQQTWNAKQAVERPEEYVLMNYLFQGDQGYTIPELFEALAAAELEFICMVNQRNWDLMALFSKTQPLPPFWQAGLPRLNMAERLQLFELIAPIHRLLDFWCGHQNQTPLWQLPESWSPQTWEAVQVTLHPQLQTETVKAALIEAIRQQQLFFLSDYLSAGLPAKTRASLSPHLAACLLPLWEGPQPFLALVQRSLTIRAYDPVTLAPSEPEQASQELRGALLSLEASLYVMLTLR
ncbi:MAG: methyltransferase domain-containing protein [Elainella sp.]